MPENTIRFAELVDLNEFQQLIDALHATTGLPYALVDSDGTLLGRAGWQTICTEFHSAHPLTADKCEECIGQRLALPVEGRAFRQSACGNGMLDYSVPVVVDGECRAHLLLCQILHEAPDLDFFRTRAERYGFDVEAYLAAVKRIPVVSRERLEACMALVVRMAQMLGNAGLASLRQREAEEKTRRLNIELNLRVAERTRSLDSYNRMLQDEIAERNRAERSLRESELRFRSILDNAPIGIALISLDGQFIEANRALCEIVDFLPGQLTKMNFTQITHPDDLPLCRDRIKQLLNGSLPSFVEEKRYLRSNGETVWVQLTATLLRDAADEPLHFIAQVEDITQRIETAERVRHLAYYDSLTGLPNRRLLADRLTQALAHARRHDRNLGVMYLDLDNFKHINDTLGHDVGDELLKEVGARIKRCVRSSDTAGRHGGDEFIVLLSEIRDAADAAAIAQKVLSALREPVRIDECILHVSASVGVALYPAKGSDNAKELLKRADAAMYAAKRSGRNRFHICDDALELPPNRNQDWMEISAIDAFRTAHYRS